VRKPEEKIRLAADAVAALVPDAGLVAVGGMHMHNNPMALVRELVRRRIRVGRLLTSPSAGPAVDLLLAAGLVDEIATSYVGFEHLGLAPAFRRRVEAGEVRVLEMDEASITHGLHAGAGGLPFVPLPRGLELSDVWRVNPESYAEVEDPFSGERFLAVRALRPDVALIHATEADERGSAVFKGSAFTDRLMALAARHLVVQVERLVPASQVSIHPAGSTIPGFLVDAVVVAPGGCLPTAAHGEYGYDEAGLREYLEAARDEAGFAAWLGRQGLGGAPVTV
jgi:glutaconate CoA-transferase, subunit A